MISQKLRDHRYLLLICILFAFLGFLRLNDLSLLNPDSARYLIIGNSLAHGKGFVDDTQPDPDRFVVHAPLYPIITAPVQIIFPLSLVAVKIWTMLWGILAIILIYFWILSFSSRRSALIAALLIAFNPLTLIYSTEVLSEAPFLVFILIFLIFAEKISTTEKPRNKDIIIFLFSITCLTLLREIGLAIVLAAVLFLIYQKKWKMVVLTLIIPAGFFILWYLRNHLWIGELSPGQGGNISLIFQHFVTPSDAPLINELGLRIFLKLKEYGIHLGGMIFYPLYTTLQFKLNLFPSSLHIFLMDMMTIGKYFVVVALIPILLRGIYIDIKSTKTGILKILFMILYIFITCLYPVYDVRFLLPLLVLFIYYVIMAFRSLEFLNNIRYKIPVVVLALVTMIPNFSHIYEIIKLNMAYTRSPIQFYNNVRHLPQYPLMFTQPWSLMGQWICENLPDTLILASSSKDIVPFVRNHKVAEIDQGVPLPVFEKLLRDNDVSYLLVPTRLEGLRVFEFSIRESKRFSFDSICTIANLNLLHVRNRLIEGDDINSHISEVKDTSQATYFLFEGRKKLQDGDYEKSFQLFHKAFLIDSSHPEVLFQNIVAHAVAGDSIGAKYYYDRLFLLPQALGYTIPAKLQMQALNMITRANAETFYMSKAVNVGKAANLYWRLGFYRRAAEIMNTLYREDSTYFMGLLWGLHYNLQMGDTAMAKSYLSTLKALDSINPVVMAFDTILFYGDLINTSTDSIKISQMHVQIGHQYRQMELDEESIDEAERALGYNPRNLNSMILLGEQYKRKNNLRMAIKYYKKVSHIEVDNLFIKAKLDSLCKIKSNL